MSEWRKIVTESSPNTIAQNTTGSAASAGTAAALATARNITISGDVAGSASFNGTQNIVLSSSIAVGAVTATKLALATNGVLGQVLTSNGNGTFAWANPSADGTVESVSAGNGMNFSTITVSGAITLGMPSSLSVSTANAVTVNSHTHQIASSSNPGASAAILATTAAGGLTLSSLLITGDLEVQGALTSIDTTNLRVTDTVVQLNTLANGTAYADSDSAVILGNVTQAHGGKIINTDSYIAFTSLHADDTGSGALPSGGVAAGVMKQIRALDLVLSTQASLPSGVVGQVAFDGTGFYIFV